MHRGFVFLFVLFVAAAASAADGPYVVQQPDGSWLARSIEGEGEAAKVSEQPVSARATLTIPAVGSLPAFTVRLRKAARVAPDAVDIKPSVPLFVVADTHGEFDIVSELLRQQRIVDAALRWTFGKGHLVVLGDVFDRGPHHLEILWCLYELEAQAAKAGGAVHFLLGNHEVMVLSGDLRYLHAKYVQSAQLLGVSSYAELFDARSVLGQWLRSKAAVLKIRDVLCLHGGISRAVADRAIMPAQLNELVRSRVGGRVADTALAELVLGPQGPLWYRGYFPDRDRPAEVSREDLAAMMERYGVSTIVVGHTRVPTVTPLYDGDVIAVQVYPHRDAVTGAPVMEALRIDGKTFQRAKIDGTREALRR